MAQNMRLDEIGYAFLKRHEGNGDFQIYNDSTGNPTVGYGHKLEADEIREKSVVINGKKTDIGGGIDPKDADALLVQDVRRFENRVNKLVTVPLTQNQFNALVSFDFNTGGLWLDDEKGSRPSQLLLAVNEAKGSGDISARLMEWVHGEVEGKMQVIEGLVNRRKYEIELFNSNANGGDFKADTRNDNSSKSAVGAGPQYDSTRYSIVDGVVVDLVTGKIVNEPMYVPIAAPPALAGPQTYTIKPGDTLSDIAAANSTTVDDILKANAGSPAIQDRDDIFPDKDIILPQKAGNAPPATSSAPPAPTAQQLSALNPLVQSPLIDPQEFVAAYFHVRANNTDGINDILKNRNTSQA